MYLRMLKAKLHHATVTAAQLNYHGSLTIDPLLMEKVGILPYEAVLVANVSTGLRGETYAIAGKPGAGEIQLNGAMARLGQVGDRLIVLCFALLTPEECQAHKPRVAVLNAANQIEEWWEG